MAKEQAKEPEKSNDCFVIMPISDPDGYKEGHFNRVYKKIFQPAIANAGFNPIRADEIGGANMIHHSILRKLFDCPMAICDLSSRNPNVLFELGFRQAFNKPVVLVQEVGTERIFDVSSIKTFDYKNSFEIEDVEQSRLSISELLKDTKSNWDNGTSVNSLIKLLSITSPALIPEADDKIKTYEMFSFILDDLSEIRSDVAKLRTVSGIESDFSYYLDNSGIFFNLRGDNIEEYDTKIEEFKILIREMRRLRMDFQFCSAKERENFDYKKITRTLTKSELFFRKAFSIKKSDLKTFLLIEISKESSQLSRLLPLG
jgi:hypothetical protein